MRDVVVIGAGITGLAAALELEQAGIPYTLIEVKRANGGSAGSVVDKGFVMDSGAMFHQLANPITFFDALNTLNIPDSVYTASEEHIAFKEGTGALVDAYTKRINAPRMAKMAVSTLGEMDMPDGIRYCICMENGMVLDAKSLIVATPARFAERMFQTLVPEISYLLDGYRYDSIARVSFGYAQSDATHIPDHPPADYPITAIYQTDHASRVPAGHVLIQIGVRYTPEKGVPADIIGETAALFDWELNPFAEHIGVWTEADPTMWRDANHKETMGKIRARLPQGVALVGSDYIATDVPPHLDERMNAGRSAARQMIAYLNKS